jgi:hypothetical protein
VRRCAGRQSNFCAHRDERRHVQFGISHIRQRLRHDPDDGTGLVAAVEARVAKLADLDGLSPIVRESLRGLELYP